VFKEAKVNQNNFNISEKPYFYKDWSKKTSG